MMHLSATAYNCLYIMSVASRFVHHLDLPNILHVFGPR